MSSLKIKIFAAEGVRVVNVPKSHVTIGTGVQCEIRLSGDGVAEEHFRIWSDGNHLWGQDLDSGFATYMNGQVLQPMRPFLFREMDLFRIGESGVSFSCQLIQDGPQRSPGVVAKATDSPPPPDQEVTKVEQENVRLTREVTNLRHQLKKAIVPRPEEEQEISQIKQSALHEINAMKDVESRRFEKWKRESVEEVERMVITLMARRQKSKLTREEISQDVSLALRTTLLGEKIHSLPTRRSGSHWKLLAAVLVSGALCAGYMFRSKLKVRRPAAVLYVPPVKQEMAPPVTTAKAKTSDSKAKAKKTK